MLEGLFGNSVIEKILFFLLKNEKSYGAELAKVLEVRLYSVQNALQRLEDGGIISGTYEGKTRVYRFNPRYPFLEELKAFLSKAYAFIPLKYQSKYYESPIRRRPRRKGKPYRMVHD